MKKDAIYMMGKAYVDFAALYEMEQVGAFFVTRAKDNMVFEVIETSYNIDERTGFVGDKTPIGKLLAEIHSNQNIEEQPTLFD